MTYDEFVDKYCEGCTPTALQKCAIKSWLDYPQGSVLWMTGRSGGKSTCLEWLRKAHWDRGVAFMELWNPTIAPFRYAQYGCEVL